MPTIEPEDSPNYPYLRRHVTLRQIAEEYRTLGAVQTAAEILKEC